VQVWGHRPAPIAIRSRGGVLEVTLRSDSTFDATLADPATLRFGPNHAQPAATKVVTVDGRSNLTMQFRPADAGIQPGYVSACLTGQLRDGVPFEGCDLLPKK